MSEAAAKRSPPKPGRARAKTMVMTNSKPDIPGLGTKKPSRPKPPAAAGGRGGASDFDWDDDELETKLFEGQEEDALAATPGMAPPGGLAGGPSQAPVQSGMTMPPPSGNSPGIGMTMPPPSGSMPGGLGARGLPPPGAGLPPPGGGGLPGPSGLPAPGGRPGGGLPPPGGGPSGGLPHPGGAPSSSPTGAPRSMPAPSGAPGAYGQQQQQQQPQYQQQQQPQQYQQQQQQQQQQYQQQQQQQYQQQAPAAVMDEDDKKSNLGLILGIVGGLLAVLAVVAFLVFGRGGGEDGSESEDGGEQPAAAVAGFNIDVTPPEAKVSVDGKDYPGGAQRIVSGLTDGPHKIEVSGGDAYMPFTQEVTLGAGQTLPLPIKLQAREVTLTIKVTPAAAEVSLVAGDQPTVIGKDAASHNHPLEREPGIQYSLTGKADGYDEATVPIAFTGDPAQEVVLTLIAQAGAEKEPEAAPIKQPTKKTTTKKVSKPKNAELKIGVAPGNPPATVYVDGKKEGRAPVFVKVTAGSHTVKWKWDDGKTDTQKVSINANESKLLKGSK